MDPENIRRAKEDYLKIPRLLCCDIFQKRITRSILTIVLMFHGTIFLIEIYYILFVFNSTEFVLNAPVFFGMFYVIIALITTLTKSHIVQNIDKEIILWDFGIAGRNVQRVLLKQANDIKWLGIIDYALALFAGVLYIVPLPVDIELFFAFQFFSTLSINDTLCIIYRCTYPILAYIMVVPAQQLLYYTQHVRLQFQLGSRFFENSLEEANKGNIFIYDKNYHAKISKTLILFVKRHIHIIEQGMRKLKEIDTLIVCYAFSGCLFGISLIVYVIEFPEKLYEPITYPRLVFTVITALLTSCIYIWTGQQFEDERDHALTTCCNAKWYLFNQTNKKTYLIFLTNLMKPFRIQFVDNYAINFKLGLAVIRGVYAVGSLFLQMKK